MSSAAVAFAEGWDVTSAPPSLRVYALAKRLPGMFPDVLAEDGQLVAEFAVYASEEGRVSAREAERANRRTGAATRSNVAGRKHGHR